MIDDDVDDDDDDDGNRQIKQESLREPEYKNMIKLHTKASRMQMFSKGNYPVVQVNQKLIPMTTVFSSKLKAIDCHRPGSSQP